MLKPLMIGKKEFSSNLIQAPLAGISCAPFRDLVWDFGEVAYCCTEMLSANHIANNSDRSPRYQTRFPNEKNLCWQLSGNDSNILAKASDVAISKGADLIDLNCGCPQPKIREKHCGSKLLEDEKKLTQLIKAMKRNYEIPITVKIRIQKDENSTLDIAKVIQNAGADALIVHGRHWTSDYDIPCQFDMIAKIVSAIEIPVIANGDIIDTEKLTEVFRITGCAGFMIARASVGQPWIFQQISLEINGKKFSPLSQKHIGQLFLKHAKGLLQFENERNAILQCRKLGKYYARYLDTKDNFLYELYKVDTYHLFEKLIFHYF